MVEVEEVGWCVGSKGERMKGTVHGDEIDINKYLVCIKSLKYSHHTHTHTRTHKYTHTHTLYLPVVKIKCVLVPLAVVVSAEHAAGEVRHLLLLV